MPTGIDPPGTTPGARAELWARIGITVQFLALVRTLAEVLRLNWVQGGRLTYAAAEPYVIGSIIAAVMCWAAVTACFFRRFRFALAISIASIPILIACKLYVLGM
jgi:hypothetical protein